LGGIPWVPRHCETTLGNYSPFFANAARTLARKFKQVHRGLKNWSKELAKLNRNLHNCCWVIAFLDGLEEARPLPSLEADFKKIVKQHWALLLEAKRTYWKQRATIIFFKFGDENSKLFQSMATHTKMRNSICQQFSNSGQCLTSHEDKAAAL
jgi:hypothetical protein